VSGARRRVRFRRPPSPGNPFAGILGSQCSSAVTTWLLAWCQGRISSLALVRRNGLIQGTSCATKWSHVEYWRWQTLSKNWFFFLSFPTELSIFFSQCFRFTASGHFGLAKMLDWCQWQALALVLVIRCIDRIWACFTITAGAPKCPRSQTNSNNNHTLTIHRRYETRARESHSCLLISDIFLYTSTTTKLRRRIHAHQLHNTSAVQVTITLSYIAEILKRCAALTTREIKNTHYNYRPGRRQCRATRKGTKCACIAERIML